MSGWKKGMKTFSFRDFQEKMIIYYGRSLQYGCKFIHQSMPRMLTAWIDYATRLIGMQSPTKEKIQTLEKMTRNIGIF